MAALSLNLELKNRESLTNRLADLPKKLWKKLIRVESPPVKQSQRQFNG
jgi:hypothetical protein